jgi:hypothetical protein
MGESMKYSGWCENGKFQTSEYSMETHMFSIEIGGSDIVLINWVGFH